MATIKEVAHYASVSVATVSRVINKTEYVSPDLEQRVREAMEALNYRPNTLARSLRRNETMTIGILIPQLDHPFFSALAFAIERELFNHNYRAFICNAEESIEKEASYVEAFLQQRVDGVIYAPTGQSLNNLENLIQYNVPTVLVDRDLEFEEIDRVLCRNFEGAYNAMCYLVDQGHRKIGVIGSPTYSEPMVLRMNGVKKAIKDCGLNLTPELMNTGTRLHFEMGYRYVTEIMNQPDPPTAVFALTDTIAMGVLHASHQLGLNVPDDLSVVGFDNIPLAEYSIPQLTTVAQPIYQMGESAARVLLARLQRTNMPQETIRLDTELVIRNSVSAPKA